MKFILLFLLTSSPLFAYTPLDIKPGMWVYKTDPSAIIEAALEKVPEAQRQMVKMMMEKMGQDKMPGTTVYQCQTEEIVKDPEAMFKQQAKSNDKMKDCDFKVTKSTKTEAQFNLTCPNGVNAKVKMLVKNSKEHTTYATVKMPNGQFQVNEVKTLGTWVGTDCSKVEALNKESMKVEVPGGLQLPGQ